jgi:hypothetical protein
MKKKTRRWALAAAGIAVVAVALSLAVVLTSPAKGKGGGSSPRTTTRANVDEYARTCRGDVDAMQATLQGNPTLTAKLFDAYANCLVQEQRDRKDARDDQDMLWLWIGFVLLGGLGAAYVIWKKQQPPERQ